MIKAVKNKIEALLSGVDLNLVSMQAVKLLKIFFSYSFFFARVIG